MFYHLHRVLELGHICGVRLVCRLVVCVECTFCIIQGQVDVFLPLEFVLNAPDDLHQVRLSLSLCILLVLFRSSRFFMVEAGVAFGFTSLDNLLTTSGQLLEHSRMA